MRDADAVLTYGELFDFVKNAHEYFPVLQAKSLFDFILNFVCALAHGKDLTLLDSDLSADEISSMGVANPAQSIVLNGGGFSDIGELLQTVKNSRSRITVFTSGTTGLPKKVVHSVSSLAANARISADYAGHVWGYCYNPTHMAGLQVFFQILLNANAAVNLFEKPKTFAFECIDKCGVSHISATPTFYRLLLPESVAHDSVRRLTLGGEKSDKLLHGALKKVFPNAKINNIYASTEGGTLLASSGEFFKIPDGLKEKILINDNELFVHKSLLGESESFVLDGDFYRTGDIIEWIGEAGGEFKFLSRKSSLVNVGGYKVNLEEVEDVLRTMPQMSDAIVYGQKNSVLGNVLCADIKIGEGQTLEVSQVRSFLADKLQQFKIPRKIRFVDHIESGASGKIKRI